MMNRNVSIQTIAVIAIICIPLLNGCNNDPQTTQPVSREQQDSTINSTVDSQHHFQLLINAETPSTSAITKVEFVWIDKDSVAHATILTQSTSKTTYSISMQIDSNLCSINKCSGFVRLLDSMGSSYTPAVQFNENTGILSYKASQFIKNSQFSTAGWSLVPNDSSASTWNSKFTQIYTIDSSETYDTLKTDTIDYTLGNDPATMKGGHVDNVSLNYAKSFDSLVSKYGYCFRDTLYAIKRTTSLPPHIDSLLSYLLVYLAPYSSPQQIFLPIYPRYDIDKGCLKNLQTRPSSISDTVTIYRSFHQIITEFNAKSYITNAPIDGLSVGHNTIVKNIPHGKYWESSALYQSTDLEQFFMTRHVTDFKATYIYRTKKMFYTRQR